MLEQNVFMETLREVREIVRTAPAPLTEEEILDYFKDMELTNAHKQMVLAYLANPEEDIPDSEESDENEAADGEYEASDNSDDCSNELPESKVFQMYLEELNNLPKLSSEELSVMYVKLLRGDSQVIQSIVNGWMGRVVEISRKFASDKYNLEDVIQEGNMGLFECLLKLCGCGEAVDVEAALMEAVETSMKSYISEITGEDDSEQTVVGKVNLINEAQKYLAIEKGCEPTLEELAEYTRMDLSELKDIMEIIAKAEKK